MTAPPWKREAAVIFRFIFGCCNLSGAYRPAECQPKQQGKSQEEIERWFELIEKLFAEPQYHDYENANPLILKAAVFLGDEMIW